ncbi:hypothetical protein MettiDRAFT_2595 [Methanolobus tindarius DSM 2278]|uniref:Probable pectate lyase C n=2 Tax=Methanolobus tindarius TaxID=2221 RepID=W9DZJ4_METTI|nr:hypothetical protein MettiDRAFT_2595 [Methanolobus tindarius DSM 2278]
MASKTTIIKNLFIIFLTLSVLTEVTAAATIGGYYYPDAYSGSGQLRILYGPITPSQLHDSIFVDGIMDTDQTLITKNSNNNFTVHDVGYISTGSSGKILFENNTVIFDRIGDTRFYGGTWDLSNSVIVGTNGDIICQIDEVTEDLSNLTFYNLGRYQLQRYPSMGSFNISDVSVYNGDIGIKIDAGITDSTIENIYMENMTDAHFSMLNGTNVTVRNFTVKNGGMRWGTGVSFLFGGVNEPYWDSWDGGHDNHAENIYIEGSGWSGLDMTMYEHDSSFTNVTVLNAGHNGIDLHGQWNVTVKDAKVYNSHDENFLITSPFATSGDSHIHDESGAVPVRAKTTVSHNINVINYESFNASGAGMSPNRVVNLFVANMTSYNDSMAINANYAKNVTFLNVTASNVRSNSAANFGTGLEYGYVEDLYVIDSKFLTVGSPVYFYDTENARLLNVKSVSGYAFAGGHNAEYMDCNYIDINVITDSGEPVSNAKVQFASKDASISSVNSWAKDQSEFITGYNGHTALPSESRENSPALASYYKNYPERNDLEFTYVSSITSPSGDVVTLTDITPDSTWYRENPNIPTYTITAIIPDESSTEPQITGFAPSSDNPFTAGESKKFQVWADEELTTMKWYVNGNLVSSGSMDYTWKVESGSTTIMFSGFNSNGAVVQTWEITEGEIVEEAPVSSGTGLSFTPSASSLTATTGESTTFSVETTQEFTSAVWSVDGTEVETGTTGHVEAWTTAGTHTVTFDGTAAAGTISRSWTVVVSAAAESEYSSISISPSTTTVAPGESFSLDVYIDPTQALTGSQFDLQYSQLASISTVDEGDLFTTGDLATTFQYDSIDNAAGLLDNVYTAIVGSGTISSPGVMATIEMVAGSSSGILDLGLSDVILSDANSNPAGYTVSNATVLIDTAPQFTSVSAQTVEEKQSLSFTVTANDADGDDLSYSSTSLPSGATFNDGSFSWTPSQGDAGSYVATFEVTDGYLTDTVSVSITVTPLNNLPEITLFEPADGSTFEEGSIIGVNVAATDADGDSLSYIIEIDSVKVSTATSYTWTTDYESAGTHTIKVTVSDGTDEVSSSGTITITDVQPRWDVNEDGTVNVLDITLVGQNYGQTYTENLPRWDVNQDGTVNIQDLSIVSGHFGETI